MLGSLGRARASPGKPDLVAVKGSEPGPLFDRGIREYGGMGTFVRKGQRVLVKPNIAFALEPERGATTHPALVGRIVEQCLRAGAKEVWVFDHSTESGPRCYQVSGIEAAAKAAGAKVAPADVEAPYQRVKIPGKSLTEGKVHELLLEADVFINVPVLKHHVSTGVTIGLKNLMGVVWNRQYWHGNDLEQCIADMAAYRKPDLTVVDAYRVMTSLGPRGYDDSDVEVRKAQILSTDPVAADAAAARLLGTDPQSITHIRKAAQAGLGRIDLQGLDIRRITI